MKYNGLNNKNQQGIALLAALMVVIIFTIFGMVIANKGKENQKVTGANVRHGVVFEATEQSIRDAVTFIKEVKGVPMAGKVNKSRDLIKDFNLSESDNPLLLHDPEYAFIWGPGELERVICGPVSATGITTTTCPSGIDFEKGLDEDFWKNNGIISELAAKNTSSDATPTVDSSNYILNTKTYTFVQLLRSVGNPSPGFSTGGPDAIDSAKGYYYLITVKGSGFPPGADTEDASKSRENVIIQAVYTHLY